MRPLIKRYAFWVVAAVGGILCGLAVRSESSVSTSKFHLTDWPSKGVGAELVEYFDPACPHSRSFHAKLEMLSKTESFKWTMVPVAIWLPPTEEPLASTLCTAPDTVAFQLAEQYSAVPEDLVPSPARLQERGPRADCSRLLAGARLQLTEIVDEGPASPVVQFKGKTYVGQDDYDALEAAVMTHD